MPRLDLTPEQRVRRIEAARAGATARAALYQSGVLERRALPKAELDKRRYRRLRKQGRCTRCRAPGANATRCADCAELESLKRKRRREERLHLPAITGHQRSADNSAQGEP